MDQWYNLLFRTQMFARLKNICAFGFGAWVSRKHQIRGIKSERNRSKQKSSLKKSNNNLDHFVFRKYYENWIFNLNIFGEILFAFLPFEFQLNVCICICIWYCHSTTVPHPRWLCCTNKKIFFAFFSLLFIAL